MNSIQKFSLIVTISALLCSCSTSITTPILQKNTLQNSAIASSDSPPPVIKTTAKAYLHAADLYEDCYKDSKEFEYYRQRRENIFRFGDAVFLTKCSQGQKKNHIIFVLENLPQKEPDNIQGYTFTIFSQSFSPYSKSRSASIGRAYGKTKNGKAEQLQSRGRIILNKKFEIFTDHSISGIPNIPQLYHENKEIDDEDISYNNKNINPMDAVFILLSTLAQREPIAQKYLNQVTEYIQLTSPKVKNFYTQRFTTLGLQNLSPMNSNKSTKQEQASRNTDSCNVREFIEDMRSHDQYLAYIGSFKTINKALTNAYINQFTSARELYNSEVLKKTDNFSKSAVKIQLQKSLESDTKALGQLIDSGLRKPSKWASKNIVCTFIFKWSASNYDSEKETIKFTNETLSREVISLNLAHTHNQDWRTQIESKLPSFSQQNTKDIHFSVSDSFLNNRGVNRIPSMSIDFPNCPRAYYNSHRKLKITPKQARLIDQESRTSPSQLIKLKVAFRFRSISNVVSAAYGGFMFEHNVLIPTLTISNSEGKEILSLRNAAMPCN